MLVPQLHPRWISSIDTTYHSVKQYLMEQLP
jgi:hypothetical protein